MNFKYIANIHPVTDVYRHSFVLALPKRILGGKHNELMVKTGPRLEVEWFKDCVAIFHNYMYPAITPLTVKHGNPSTNTSN